MNYKELEGEKRIATVQIAPNQTAVAEFLLDGQNSYLKIHSPQSLHFWTPPAVIFGVLGNGAHIAFYDCVSLGEQSSFIVGKSKIPIAAMRYITTLFPHGVVIGGLSLTENVRFCSVQISVDDAAEIFYDFDTFGYVSSPHQCIEFILEKTKEKRGRSITAGENPIICYFTGKEKICEIDSSFGKISVNHTVSESHGLSKGIHLDDRIFIDLQLQKGDEFSKVLDKILVLLRFFQIMAGRPQNLLSIEAQIDDGTGSCQKVDIYWPYKPLRRENGDNPNPTDILINGSISKDQFTSVMSKWLDFDATRLEARVRFADTFSNQNFYDTDRIIAAANMFDILPPDALPSEKFQLPLELMRAHEVAKKEFEQLSQSPERDSILSALGRLGSLTLKRKVKYRASYITPLLDDKLPDLDFVLSEAINCRNRYVHGSFSRVDYGVVGKELVPFLTDTLEFVFGASELIEAGWNIFEWVMRNSALTHPWRVYFFHYKENLNKLKVLFPQNSA
ncbi:ApeA N-terminal domain 1-containing protein [Acidocella facilis]|uniref:ApeA N-terminal domain 1-containing protein n=1 Tax=Acidocella facilis TaxID=525 RepID=UPI001F287B32|nr:hypothetical protein [Acidocella facilis]